MWDIIRLHCYLQLLQAWSLVIFLRPYPSLVQVIFQIIIQSKRLYLSLLFQHPCHLSVQFIHPYKNVSDTNRTSQWYLIYVPNVLCIKLPIYRPFFCPKSYYTHKSIKVTHLSTHQYAIT